MTMLQDSPRALQIVSLDNDRLDLMENGSRLTYILNKCRDKKVVVISITGTARKGKSFLMSFILQYLRHNGWMVAAHDWMRDIDKDNCFDFGPGTTPVTKGIFMWSEPILVKDHEGNEMAVLLVDAQGLYDEKTSIAGNKLLCALTSLMSSLLLVNVHGSFDEKYLESFSEMFDFGRQVISDEGRNPFQQLIFAVRDFDLEEELIGWEGGKKELDRFLSESDDQSWDNHYNRRKMKACYPNPGCFLFPHPGTKVTKKAFTGKLNDVEVDFLQAVKSFVGRLPQEAKVRTMDGFQMTGNDLFRWMEVIVPKLNEYIATATSRGLKTAADTAQALVLIRKYYDQYMNEVALGEIKLNSDDNAERQTADDFTYNLRDIHFKAKQKAIGSLSKKQVAKVASIDYQSIHGTPSTVLKSLLDARYKEGKDAFARLIEWKETMEKQAWHKDKMSLMKDELPFIKKKLAERTERLLHDMEQTKIPKPGYWRTVGNWWGRMTNAAGTSFVAPLLLPAAMIVAAGEVLTRKD